METIFIKNYIPLDKSWIIRIGVLDLLNEKKDILKFLKKQRELPDDLQTLKKILIDWKSNKPINVGESGTLYRFLKFISWKFNLNKKFILRGTLKKRKIANDKKIINYSLKKLLKLDNGTSQWASASVLCGNKEIINNPPFKLKLTYEAVKCWNKKRGNKCWLSRFDKTIFTQASIFLKTLHGKNPNFTPRQAEDYCFARAFGYITKEYGKSEWPSLLSHESNRVKEIEKMLKYMRTGKSIDSKDHRVIQAIAMLQKINGKKIKIKYPLSVNKSWPQFWRFLNDSKKF